MQVSQISGAVEVRTWKTDAEMDDYFRLFKRATILGNSSVDNILGSFVCQVGLLEDRSVDLGVGIRKIRIICAYIARKF
jgi:hypothetical protein